LSDDPKPNPVEAFISVQVGAVARSEFAVFCGAGISVHSGMPTAGQLVARILRHLPMSDEDRDAIHSSILPFEAFLDTLNVGADLTPLLTLFKSGSPNANHRALARLAKKGYIHTICTTNFDLLIERALLSEGLVQAHDFNVYHTPDQFDSIPWDGRGISIIKLHGSAEDLPSLVATLRQVAARHRNNAQERLIKRIFSSGPHEAVLVLGYSCSDIFDISPQIEAIKTAYKTITIVDHVASVPDASTAIQPVQLKADHNPFHAARAGVRARIDTDSLISALFTLSEGHFVTESGITPWADSVVAWAKSLIAKGAGAPSRVVGRLFENLTDATRAKHYFQHALATARSAEDFSLQAQSLADLGRIATSTGAYDAAVAYHSQSLALAHEMKDTRGIASQLGNLGNAYHNLGKDREAIDHHTQSLALAREIGDMSIEAHELGNLALSYRSRGEYARGAELHREAIRVHRLTGDKLGEGRQLGNLGLCLRRMRQYEDAKTCHLRSLNILQQLGNRRGVALELGNLGVVHSAMGEHKQAIAYLRQGLPIARAVRDRLNEANLLGDLADTFVTTAHYRRAICLGMAALRIAEDIKHKREQAVHHSTLAKAYMGLRDRSNSLRHAEIALEAFTSLFGVEHEMTKDARETLMCLDDDRHLR
jgi:tetratricopeptide (TPR) repeat protein